MWFRISSLTRSLSLPVQKHSGEPLFSPVFSRVRASEGIQPLYVSILQYKTWTVVTRWTWTLDDADFYWLYLASPWFVPAATTNRTGGEHLPALQARRPCRRSIRSRFQIFPQRKFSVPRTFSMDNGADPGSQSSCLCKAGLSHHPRTALAGEDLRMAPGQGHQPSAIPTCPRGGRPPIAPGLTSPG